MKQLLMVICICSSVIAFAQDNNVLFKEAENLERGFKETEALNKYKQILTNDAVNIKALVKATELSCSIGNRIDDKNEKRINYESGLAFAQRAIKADNNSAEANYAFAMASGKMTEVETENKKIVTFVNDTKNYVEKALAKNANYGKANFVLGRWHYEMVTLSGLKKAAVKVFYGGLPEATLDNAILYMEKCKNLEPYYMINYYYLNKAYKENDKPAKQIEVLSKLIKLPIRNIDDAAMKEDAQKQLQQLQ
ncbi:MAG: hypothetical protein H7101_01440 [Deinococcales bacterium]|nr:hypothetical protein [Chitinophagaceae bacterium]